VTARGVGAEAVDAASSLHRFPESVVSGSTMRPVNACLRPAREGDAPEIARLAGELGYPTAVQEIASRVEYLLADPNHHVIVAEGPKGLLGWMHVGRRASVESPEQAELMGLVVDAAARRSGLGGLLVSAAEEWASGRGLTRITVRSNVVRSMSHPFYERAGYSRAKTQHVYVKLMPAG
jgi:GNAT superfamily N-acetyltransferase